jgi:fumarate reductase subunit D
MLAAQSLPTVSPYMRFTAPLACLPISPVSKVICLAKNMVLRLLFLGGRIRVLEVAAKRALTNLSASYIHTQLCRLWLLGLASDVPVFGAPRLFPLRQKVMSTTELWS